MSAQIGTRYDTVPIPPVEENTTWVDAGALRFGVEYRLLDDTILAEAFAGRPDEEAIVNAARPEVLADRGWSIHVADASTGDELLRFDMFDSGPHYHYIVPGSHNLSIDFDEHACGPMPPWVLSCLGRNLQAMLCYAGAEELADEVRPDSVDLALAEVERILENGSVSV